jgi:hypothetical protein
VAHEIGEPALRRDQQAQRDLRRRRLVHARRVRVDEALWQHVGHAVVSDRLALNQPRLDLLHRAEHPALLHIRRDDDVDVVTRRIALGPQYDLDVVGGIQERAHVRDELVGGDGNDEGHGI